MNHWREMFKIGKSQYNSSARTSPEAVWAKRKNKEETRHRKPAARDRYQQTNNSSSKAAALEPKTGFAHPLRVKWGDFKNLFEILSIIKTCFKLHQSMRVCVFYQSNKIQFLIIPRSLIFEAFLDPTFPPIWYIRRFKSKNIKYERNVWKHCKSVYKTLFY